MCWRMGCAAEWVHIRKTSYRCNLSLKSKPLHQVQAPSKLFHRRCGCLYVCVPCQESPQRVTSEGWEVQRLRILDVFEVDSPWVRVMAFYRVRISRTPNQKSHQPTTPNQKNQVLLPRSLLFGLFHVALPWFAGMPVLKAAGRPMVSLSGRTMCCMAE